jgi:hypothetical protein
MHCHRARTYGGVVPLCHRYDAIKTSTYIASVKLFLDESRRSFSVHGAYHAGCLEHDG